MFSGEHTLRRIPSPPLIACHSLTHIPATRFGAPPLVNSAYFSQHPDTGGVGIEVNYEDAVKVFTPEQVIACMLTKVRRAVIKQNLACLCYHM